MDGLSIAAALAELREVARGGLVRSVHRPLESTFVVGLFARGNVRLLISPRQARIHITRLDLPNPKSPDGFTMLLRKHLRGARLERIDQDGLDRIVRLRFARRDEQAERRYDLVAELTGVRGNLLLLEDGRVLGSSRSDPRNPPGRPYQEIDRQPKTAPSQWTESAAEALLADENPARALVRSVDGLGRAAAEDLAAALQSSANSDGPGRSLVDLLRRLQEASASPRGYVRKDGSGATFYPVPLAIAEYESFSEALDHVADARGGADEMQEPSQERSIRQRLEGVAGRKRRTAEKLRAWLRDAEHSKEMRHSADLVMLHLADLGPGTREAIIPDPMSGERIRIPLNPVLDGRRNAQWLYKQARKRDRGRASVRERLERIEAEIETLERAKAELAAGRGIDEAAESLLAVPTKGARPTAVLAPRRFQVDGYTILVGKSAAQNDQLVREAAPEDLWLHARGASGAHVIIRGGGQPEIPAAVVEEAARLAVRYSHAEPGRRVQVSVTRAKHVRKPKGAAPGLVIIRNEDTLTVNPGEREEKG
jgi:predicted ribosome quality control (RQC) complex YloA/Tae2 family protein